MKESLRKSGIDIIGDVPWGTHFCQFYQTREDLIDILVPYFKAGLENNELCMWITSHPPEVEEAKEALRKAVPDIDVYLEKGQMKIVPYTHGYLREGNFDPEKAVNSWVEKINKALARGYDGLRAAGDNRWLEKEGWKGFIDYENKVDSIIDKRHVIALCPYYLDTCSAAEIIDAISSHQFALIKREGKWERIENSGRGRAEKEAIQAAKNWEQTFDAVPDLIAITDDKDRIIRANRAMAARLGITPEEYAELACYRVIHGIDKPPSFCLHKQLVKDSAKHTTEIFEECLSGNFLVSTSPLYDPEEKLFGSVYVAHDISERKQEEHRIRRYNRVLEGINQIFSNVVQAKTEEEVGNACLSVALEVTGSEFGFINEMGADGLLHDVAKSQLGWEQCFMYDKTGHRRPPSVFAIHGLYGSVIVNEKGFFTNDPPSHPDSIGLPLGHPPLISFLGVPLVQGGKTIGLVAVANREGGYSSEQQEDLEAIAPAVVQALQRKRSEEALKEAHDNLEKLVEERTKELEKTYESLKESEEGLAEAQRMAHIGNWDLDLVSDKGHWSDELYRIFGRNPQDSTPSYDELLNYIHPGDRDYVDKNIKRGLKERPKSGIDYRIILANGEERTVHSRAEVIFDEQNIPVRLKGIVQDITERKKIEAELELVARLSQENPDPVIRLARGQIINYANPSAQVLLIDWGGAIGKEAPREITEPSVASLGDGIRRKLECSYANRTYMIDLAPFPGAGYVNLYAHDITERKKAKEALEKIDKIRIKEIHHRIKNNLQVISSLLDLQAEKFNNRENIKGSEVLETIRESQNRVTSMSLIHEELYKGERNDTLNFSAYLQKLAENLFQTYSLKSKNVRLCTDLEENTLFDMDIAVPLGIIVNELVSNSLKHAFTENKEGEIQIKLHREEKGNEMHKSLFSLSISDNGKGIPEDVELESTESLGLQLVSILADQLDGKIELKRTYGTEFRINFNVTEKS